MRLWTRRRLLLSTASAASTAALTATASAPAHALTGKPPAPDDAIVRRLGSLPGVRIVEERPSTEPGHRLFVLGLRQPVDHTDPSAGTFEQRLTLLHTSTERPTV
ncbi:hypothetical protein KDL01_42380, partial [Actinospica durhamensis]